MPEIGEIAPDFTLSNQDGQTISLSDYRGKSVILFAFPKANNSGCNKQACGFRDYFPQIEAVDAVILGISADTQADLQAWKEAYHLPYDLLSDTTHQVLAQWGAWGELRFKERQFYAPLRSFWVIDPDGKVVDAQIRITADESVQRAMTALTMLNK